MMKHKHAFTLPELLIAFTIIGILSVISLYTINNRFTDFFTRYYSAYDALNKAVYNTYTDTYCRQNSTDRDCSTSSEYTTGRAFPESASDLCSRLAEYLNVAGDSNCGSTSTVSSASDNDFNKNSDTYLQFALTNGFRFYFSGKKTATISHAGRTSKTINYFIVYIDLNGSAKPNTANYSTAGGHPDIVPFIVMNTGDVIPVGFPVFDKTYASARIITSEGEETTSYTIDGARQIAFGGGKYYIDIPLTLIEYFHKNNILPSNARPDTSDYPTYSIGSSYGCAQGTFACTVKIDETLGIRH